MNSKVTLYLDYIFGVRIWGLALYSMVTLFLIKLGVYSVDIEFSKIDLFGIKYVLIPVLIILNLCIIYKYAKIWYLSRELLYLRTITATIVILVINILSGLLLVLLLENGGLIRIYDIFVNQTLYKFSEFLIPPLACFLISVIILIPLVNKLFSSPLLLIDAKSEKQISEIKTNIKEIYSWDIENYNILKLKHYLTFIKKTKDKSDDLIIEAKNSLLINEFNNFRGSLKAFLRKLLKLNNAENPEEREKIYQDKCKDINKPAFLRKYI